MNRRTYLKSLAGAGALSFAGVGTVSAETPDLDDEDADHIVREFDEELLARYQPLLVLRGLEVQPEALYGYVARSSEYDTTVLSYWARYPFQRGVVSGPGSDSHYLDREPILVEIDETTGEILEIIYSGYHYLAARDVSPEVVEKTSGTHPTLAVVPRWHHYVQTPEEGVAVDLAPLSDSEIQSWLDNGWTVAVEALAEPWVMTGRDGRPDWWPDTVGTFSIEALFRRIYLTIGVRGADDVDERLLQ